ncbi:hypothetical protein CEXT_323661 [Caerostris extrusa]|uniref:Uncharacterized protein n=1 Tax=Caerostris extrusa TaxID=172846 RepID=A0AAV4VF48_CAEEX|nr:hypothetical protein CEXT_323661 [Caerostris extrusa]
MRRLWNLIGRICLKMETIHCNRRLSTKSSMPVNLLTPKSQTWSTLKSLTLSINTEPHLGLIKSLTLSITTPQLGYNQILDS